MKYINNISPEEFERIERFITDAMTQQEANVFTHELSNDVELQEKTEEVKLLLLGIKEFCLEQQFESFHNEVKSITIKKNARILALPKLLLVAASVIVVVSLSVWWLLQNTNDQTYGQYYSPDPGLATVMSSSSKYHFDKAMVEYKNGEYDKATSAWKDLLKTRPNDTLYYFIACASQAKKDYDEAIENFKQVVKNPAGTFYKDACWYLGLVYLKKDQLNDAAKYIKLSERLESKAILKKISEE